MICVLSFLCIGAIGSGDSSIALIILALMFFYLARKVYLSRAKLFRFEKGSEHLLKSDDYGELNRENIKKAKSIKDNQLGKNQDKKYKDKHNHSEPGGYKNEEIVTKSIFDKSKTHHEYRYIAFDYKDSKGENSYREVDVKYFDGEYIKAYCHSAKAMRTFRVDRIRNDLIIRSSGEIVSIEKWIVLYK